MIFCDICGNSVFKENLKVLTINDHHGQKTLLSCCPTCGKTAENYIFFVRAHAKLRQENEKEEDSK